MHKEAAVLNSVISKNNPVLFEFLSKKGQEIFFPKSGLMAQTQEALKTKINATVGMATEKDGSPMRLKSIASNINLDAEDVFPYSSCYGSLQLRERWKELIFEKNPSLKSNISLPVVTSALTHGLNIFAYLFLNEGDEILTADRFWGNYRLIFEHGFLGNIKTYNFFKDNGFDVDSLEKELISSKAKKKIVLLNFPNNPTGYSPTTKDALRIKDVLLNLAKKGEKIVVVCDDAYFGLRYKDDVYSESMFSLLCNLHENIFCVKIDGATKEDYVWGLRVGFITYGGKNINKETYDALEDKTAGVVRGTVSNVSRLSQSLVLKGLMSKDYAKEKKEKFGILKERHDKLCDVLTDSKYEEYFSPLPFNSGYFMCLQLKKGDSEGVRKKLLEKYNTGVIALPGNIIRIAYSSVSVEKIEELIGNIYAVCSKSN